MAKKIKAFTVDGEIYDALIRKFKKHAAKKSISFVVDKILKELFECLETLESRYNESKEYSVPMSYVIDAVLGETFIRLEEYLDEETLYDVLPGKAELNEIQARYDAEKEKIPVFYARAVRSGKYTLSKDKRYITDAKTGIRYCLNKNGEIEDYKEE